LKNSLVSAPTIQPLQWSQPFKIMGDESDYAVGAVLGCWRFKTVLKFTASVWVTWCLFLQGGPPRFVNVTPVFPKKTECISYVCQD
jgi:hypothetical protein